MAANVSACDDILWTLANCTRPETNWEACCFPEYKGSTEGRVRSAVFACIGAMGFVGNAVNVTALSYARRQCREAHSPLLHSTTLLVISMSVCDLLFSTTVVINSIPAFTRGWHVGQVSCTVVAFVMHVAGANSLIHLGVMAINRCLGVWLPSVCALLFDSLKGFPPIVLMWATAIAECVPCIHSAFCGYLGYNPRYAYCTFNDLTAISNYKLIAAGIQYILPLVLIGVSSFLIYIKVRRSRRQLQAIADRNVDLKVALRTRERKLTIIFASISTIYVVCVTPYFFVILHLGLEEFSSLTHFFAGFFYALNFAANVFVYAFRVPAYREAYLLLFSKVCCFGKNNAKEHSRSASTKGHSTTDTTPSVASSTEENDGLDNKIV